MLTLQWYEQYRPPGRSNRSGRSQADQDVFEGLPVKQWGQQISRISLAPPASESADGKDDKWAEPPMPRDYQLLLPHTQQLLRLARSGKVGTKRKPDPDSLDEDRPDEEAQDETKANLEDRGYIAKRWKPIPEALLEPEHKHFEFLAKRRKGLPSLYGPDVANGAVVPMRKTMVRKAGPDGEVNVYEVLVPEGQVIDGEITQAAELAEVKAVVAAPGTVIDGVGIANEDGVIVAEHLRPSVGSRRNRPPPKKKGGPGRGKKRVTFTNPDGSTYTTVVPNATKIVPQPGQTVKHVSKGEEAAADISVEQAAASAPAQPIRGEGEAEQGDEQGDEGDDDGSDDGEDGEDDDDREEGEVSDDDAPGTAGQTPAPTLRAQRANGQAEAEGETEAPATPTKPQSAVDMQDRDASSSPELPLAKATHSRQASTVAAPPVAEDPGPPAEEREVTTDVTIAEAPAAETEKFEDGEEDLLGSLEKHLEGDG
ncbi:hypothetical protein Tdes44962_MAKER04350 [Teratosphaeria destructans]|uniref:Uncharacterized protein n=1 Tax=Teratosphaeria destructans TaxID=418781 RepID=A0A9W7SMH1_9PEZI|nr:hypothetical protein Tdes44962_MAKER04350 [Teratosphaeria destructans]